MSFDFHFCFISLYIHNCVHMIFKIWYIIIILSYFLLCAVHLMQGFVYEKMLQRNQNYSQGRSFLTGNEENPAIVLSNVHNRTSARDGPMFGPMGLSMYTTSLGRGMGFWASDRQTPVAKVPLQIKVLDETFCIAIYESYLSGLLTV